MKRMHRWRVEPTELIESTEELYNPGRGWYQIHTFDTGTYRTPEEMRSSLHETDALVLLLICIPAGGEALNEEEMDWISCILKTFSDAGKDILLRFVYDLEGKGLENEPDRFAIVERHFQQLSELMGTQAQLIYVYQGILVGSWGEMHTSRYLSPRYMRRLASIFREGTGGRIYHSVRKPVQWRQLFDREDWERAAQIAKTGLYNDGILASETDLGTFGNQSGEEAGWEQSWLPLEELDFEERLCRHAPQGGEVVYGEMTEKMSLEQIAGRLSRMNLSYLNRDHDKRVFEIWKKLRWEKEDVWQGMNGFDYIGRHLGYRFVVRQAVLKPKRKEMKLQLEIENIGFARMYEEAELLLEYEDPEGNTETQRIETDVRNWNPGQRISLSQRLLPGAGSYFLAMRRCQDGRAVYFSNRQGEKGRLLLGKVTVC
ncbi:MAG: DUF4832 domain-containing protein [Eubacterium sp.]|jgi:hypothetical protein|nr:DUF4832 domain-containing protein [Eubacterium sp.]